MTRNAPDIPFLGLCDQTAGEQEFLVGLIDADPHEIERDTHGTNHMTWTRGVRVGGGDVTPQLWDLLDSVPEEEFGEDARWWRMVRLFRVFRLIPGAYMQYFVFHDDVVDEIRASGRTRAELILAELPAMLESYPRDADEPDPRPIMQRASEEHGDLAVSVMAAVHADEDARFILNVPNRGTISSLPGGAAVEIPRRLQGRAVQPVAQGALPPVIAGLVGRVANHSWLTAEAVTGDRTLAVRALLAHPLVRSLDLG